MNYAAAKSALQWRGEVAGARDGQPRPHRQCRGPGIIAAGMAQDQFGAEQIRQMVPAGRAGTPQEVAALVVFLCSEAAGYINGQVIGINGGMG